MSTVEFIQRSLEFTHAALIDARNGTDEQLHYVPEQGSHSIAWCLWHTSRVEDLIIGRVSDQPQVWSEEWARRTGLPFDGFGTGMSDEDARRVHVADVDALAGYQDAVFERTAAFLAAATDEDLEREIPAPQWHRERRRGYLPAHDGPLQRPPRRDQHPPGHAGHAHGDGCPGHPLEEPD